MSLRDTRSLTEDVRENAGEGIWDKGTFPVDILGAASIFIEPLVPYKQLNKG